jgi:hypothetical protein
MTGNLRYLRYLTADGEVIPASRLMDDFCTYSGELCWSFRSAVDESRVVVAYEDDPCVWDATCTTCEGYGIVPRASMAVMGDGSPVPKGNTCQTCGGTGVDETIPLRLVGVGSVVRSAVTGLSMVVVSRDADDWLTCADTDGAIRIFPVTDLGSTWTVVRAVPPAHTEATP